ncbi:MAG: hypothetical protein HY327_03925 [Chloroflexi bacterium]|nr:hypothetical protein [Chloroflexota bacterium]
MDTANFWTRERFPIVYEEGKPKSVLVDITTFEQMELILDNLVTRESEPEDTILAASSAVKTLVERARRTLPTLDWERQLNEL